MMSRSDGGIKTISIDTLKFYLVQTDDDALIAKQAGCSLAVVRMVRGMFDIKPQVTSGTLIERPAPVVRKPRPTPKLAYKPARENPSEIKVDFWEMKNRRMVECGSLELLKRQLEVGQHWLNKEQFISVCHEVGLGDKLPPHLLG